MKFFKKNSSDMWVPCEPTERGAVQVTLQELDAQGLASKVSIGKELFYLFIIIIINGHCIKL